MNIKIFRYHVRKKWISALLLSIFSLLITPALADFYFTWAHLPTSDNYQPYTFYSSSGDVEIERQNVGDYKVNIGLGVVRSTGNVQITAYGSKNFCNIKRWGGGNVYVGCYDPQGEPADTKFNLLYTKNAIGGETAYTWANKPEEERYDPLENYTYNDGRIARIIRLETGFWKVFLGQIVSSNSGAGGNAQVTAYSNLPHYCFADDWHSDSVYVRCIDQAGEPVNTRFSMLFSTGRGNSNLAYVVANKLDASEYTADPLYSEAPAGAVSVNKISTGRYSLHVGDIASANANVQISTLGDIPLRCSVDRWSGGNIYASCVDSNGEYADGAISVLIIKKNPLIQTPVILIGDDNNDGIPNDRDASSTNGPDIDGDGVDDRYDVSFVGGMDTDGDSISNDYDSDMDGDGVSNLEDTDRDGDGVLNQFDSTPDGADIAIDLDVIQYNTQFLSPHPEKLWTDHWPNTRERAVLIGEQLACFDVAALNETVNDKNRGILIDSMNAAGRYCGKPLHARNGKVFESVSGPDLAGGILQLPSPADLVDLVESGTATPIIDDELTIVSRYPIVSSDSHIFTRGTGIDAFAAKGVLYANLWRGPGINDYLDVFATHLNAGDSAIKFQQLQELISFVQSRHNPDTPTLILGDFNIGPPLDGSNQQGFDSMLQQLKSAFGGIKDLGEGLGPTNATIEQDKDDKRRVDHIFLLGRGAEKMELKRLHHFYKVPPFTDIWGEYPTLSDHMAVSAGLSWPEGSTYSPPRGTKEVTVKVVGLRALSTDSCNEFMDFYGSMKLTAGAFERHREFGIIEGNRIAPDWMINAELSGATRTAIADIVIKDEDDLICGGGDDTVDVHPDTGIKQLKIYIDFETGKVLLKRAAGWVEVGDIGSPIWLNGTHGDEIGEVTIIVTAKESSNSPPVAPLDTNKEREVTLRINRLQAVTEDACDEMEFYGSLRFTNPGNVSQSFPVREGNDITPNWKINGLVPPSRATIDAYISIKEEDDFFCGGGDDTVDVNPHSELTNLNLRINLDTMEIWSLHGNALAERLGFIGETISTRGNGGDETAEMYFTINAREIETPVVPKNTAHRLRVDIQSVRATSNDSCGEMEFYGSLAFSQGGTGGSSFGIMEGDVIYPDWVSDTTLSLGVNSSNIRIVLKEEDDFFCGGGDDTVDINPQTDSLFLDLQVDVLNKSVYLLDRQGQKINRLGSTGAEITTVGTNGNETASMTFKVSLTPL